MSKDVKNLAAMFEKRAEEAKAAPPRRGTIQKKIEPSSVFGAKKDDK